MIFFNRSTKKKHIEQFELKVANLLKAEYPQFLLSKESNEVSNIYFSYAPSGISIVHQSRSDKKQTLFDMKSKIHFKLTGVYCFHKKKKIYDSIDLNYVSGNLIFIHNDEPTRFHINYDLSNVIADHIQIENLPLQNPDLEIVNKILKTLSQKQKQTLDIESTFEIILNNRSYYTVLDMEDGNCIAIDKSGAFYRLNHDHEHPSRKIAKNSDEFFTIYDGNKSKLESIMSL